MPLAGKSTLAQFLGEKLNYTIHNTDKMIEESEGRSISEIFSENGEFYFRQKEREFLHKITKSGDHVIIDTGGGLPCFYDNMKFLRSISYAIWLDTPLRVIAERSLICKDRPLLQNLPNNLEMRIQYFGNLRFERMHYYGQAHRWIRQLNF